MQVIQTIRDKGAAIVIGVIALSLIGFLLMDAKSGNNSLFGGNSTLAGKINGVSISRDEYNNRVTKMENQPQQRTKGSELRDQVWEQYIYETLVNQQSEKAGIDFTANELDALLNSSDPQNPLFQQKEYLDSITGKIDRTKVTEFKKMLKKTKGITAEQKQQIDQTNEYLNSMVVQMKAQKLTAMLNAGSSYYANWMQDRDNKQAKTFATISYVQVPYGVITDSAVGEIKDAEIEAYVNKHKSQFKQDAGRQLSVVTFSILPTKEDTASVLGSVASLKASFAADSNAKQFVGRNSSSISFFDGYTQKSKMQMQLKDSITAAGIGRVFGPYLDGGSYVMSKIISTKIMPDSIKCRHILLGTRDPQSGQEIMDDSTAHKLADSVANLIKAGGDFIKLANQFSTDKVANQSKGEMTFDVQSIQNGGIAKEFGDFLMNENGETKKVVKTQFGYHYIELLEKKNQGPAYKIAYMARQIVASEGTISAAQRNATQLAAQCRNAKDLDAYTAKNGLQKITLPNTFKETDTKLQKADANPYNMQKQEFPDATSILRWAFGAKEGEVSSETFPYGPDNIIVPVVERVYKEGTKSAKDARPMVEAAIRNEKKAATIKTKIGNTLESAAAAYPGLSIQQAGADSSITYAGGMIKGVGPDNKLIGTIFSKDANTKINTVAGNSAVYVVKVDGYADKAANSPQVDAEMKKQKEQALFTQASQYNWFEQLKKQITIKDKRNESYQMQ